ncbi:MAG: hypothetical protein E6R03_06775 [Hyphomicrobiaceae bacterium]|nr:MAG: hypothetical protein E6R03_06775 [Hyphomicrobiaceae bacterium]
MALSQQVRCNACWLFNHVDENGKFVPHRTRTGSLCPLTGHDVKDKFYCQLGSAFFQHMYNPFVRADGARFRRDVIESKYHETPGVILTIEMDLEFSDAFIREAFGGFALRYGKEEAFKIAIVAGLRHDMRGRVDVAIEHCFDGYSPLLKDFQVNLEYWDVDAPLMEAAISVTKYREHGDELREGLLLLRATRRHLSKIPAEQPPAVTQ